MPEDPNKISPKVLASGGGGLVGYGVGTALATIFMHFVVGATPPEVAKAIEVVFEAGFGLAGTLLGGYFKSA